MDTTNQFLDQVKARYGIGSDYALAKKLGVTRAVVSAWRMGKRQLGEEAALTVADLLDLDTGYVLACMEAERTRSAAARAAWQRLADRAKDARPRCAAATRYGAGRWDGVERRAAATRRPLGLK